MGTGSTSATVTVQDNVNVLANEFCDGISGQQKATINTMLNEFNNYSCSTKFLSSYFKTAHRQFKFCIGGIAENASYTPGTNNITFSTNFSASLPFILEHELTHAFQDALYPGGTQQYARVGGIPNRGFANIEFEQAVIADMVHGSSTAFNIYGTDPEIQAYLQWISGLTNNHTTFPRFKPAGTPAEQLAYTDFLTSYNSFLSKFNNLVSNPYHSELANLQPLALINLFNNIPLDCQ